MIQFHSITLTVFVKEGEDEVVIWDRLAALVPLDLAQEKITIQREAATSAEDKPIIILSIMLKKPKHTAAFAAWLRQALTAEQKRLLDEQALTRLDQGLNFFIRFDKRKWLEEELQITDSGRCFHCKMNLAAYPAKWEKGLEMIRELLH